MADEIRSAGAVVWRPGDGAADVLLVHRPKYDDWSFAKGKVEPGEHVLAAAVREVAEETGLAVNLGRRLPSARYLVAGGQKRVDYWAATAEPGAAEFVQNNEVDDVAWVPAGPAAQARLSYQRDADTLAALGRNPLRTVPLIVLRHASAGSRTDWPGDESRPLDAEGEHDAGALAGLLRCFGVSRIVSSPAERCVATVRPYAAAIAAAVEAEPAFDIAAPDGTYHAAVPAADVGKTAAALAAAAEPLVICAHRENLPVIVAAVCAELGTAPPAGGPLRKGEFWVLHRAGRQLAAAERYHPAGDD